MTDDDAVDLETMLDLTTPWCLRVAATLRIPEHVAAGRATIAELATAAGCDRDALHAVLGHLVSRGVFTEPSPGRFAVNQAAERLGQAPFLDLDGIGGRLAHTWGHAARLRPHRPARVPARVRPALNDWPDEPTMAILRRCAEAARPGASIAVLGGVSADEAPRSLGIDMLVAGGKTSTLTQFTELARQAGLGVAVARTQTSGRYVVECRPVGVGTTDSA